MTQKTEATKRERIRVEKTQIDRYRELAGIGAIISKKRATGPDMVPFRGLKDVFMLAFCLGYQMKKRTELKSREDLIYVNYLNDHTDMTALYGVAISETKGVDVLNDLNEVCTIAEEYASTGFEELDRRIRGKGRPTDNLVGLLVDGYGPLITETKDGKP